MAIRLSGTRYMLFDSVRMLACCSIGKTDVHIYLNSCIVNNSLKHLIGPQDLISCKIFIQIYIFVTIKHVFKTFFHMCYHQTRDTIERKSMSVNHMLTFIQSQPLTISTGEKLRLCHCPVLFHLNIAL